MAELVRSGSPVRVGVTVLDVHPDTLGRKVITLQALTQTRVAVTAFVQVGTTYLAEHTRGLPRIATDTGVYQFDAAAMAGWGFATVEGTQIGACYKPAANRVGFFGAAPVTRPKVTGTIEDGSALTSLLTQLAALGLITDESTQAGGSA